MNTSTKILFLIYFICVIPTIAIYYMHGSQELGESLKLKELGNETKAMKTQAEGWFLTSTAAAYGLASLAIIILPRNLIGYYMVLIVTVSAIIIFMARSEYGVPIPFTDLVITKYTVGWEGFWTKTLQSVILVVTTMLLDRRKDI